MPIEFVRRRFDRSKAKPQLMQLFTPNVVGPDRPATRLLLGGATAVGLVVAGVVALTSMAVLLGALFGIYLLLTEVLGLELDMDPRAFVAQAQKYAAQGRN